MIVSFFTFCRDNNKARNIVTNKIDKAKILKKTGDSTTVDTLRSAISNLSLSNAKHIEILSSQIHLLSDSLNNEYTKNCRNWTLTEQSIIKIFRMVKPITRHEFNYQFYVLPCEVKGVAIIDKRKVPFLINAGSYVKLFGSDTTLIFGCKEKRCKEFFLEEND